MRDYDYTDGDRFDFDHADDSQHCEHGTFVGSWWGPDILCGWCEDGISADSDSFRYRGFWVRNSARKARRKTLRAMYAAYVTGNVNPSTAVLCMHIALDVDKAHPGTLGNMNSMWK